MTRVRLICEADKATKESSKMNLGIPDNISNNLHSKFQKETGAQLESAKRLDSVVSEVALLRAEINRMQTPKYVQRISFWGGIIGALAAVAAAVGAFIPLFRG